jgi:glycosyltransferase involved in cell wall biosynthesis
VIIGAAGRLSPEKGQKFLVEMAARLKQHHIPFTLLIAGEGPLKHELKKLIREAGLDDQVIFTGFIENIKAFMSTIDIFVLPSLWEGFGYVTVEAMACRKPVVAFRVGSNPEIILDSITGYLVKGYDVAALSEKMNLLIGDPMLRESFGKAGRKRVEEVFSMSRSVQEIEQYLAGL